MRFVGKKYRKYMLGVHYTHMNNNAPEVVLYIIFPERPHSKLLLFKIIFHCLTLAVWERET